jgi:hypothetical protein
LFLFFPKFCLPKDLKFSSFATIKPVTSSERNLKLTWLLVSMERHHNFRKGF